MPARQQGPKPPGDPRPLGGKIDDFVAKIVPARWLPTAFAGAAVGAIIFLVLMILGFAWSPDLDKIAQERIEKAETDREDASKDLKDEKVDHSETKKKLRDAQRDADRVQAAEKAEKRTKEKLADLEKKYDAERTEKSGIERKLKSAASERKKAVTGVMREWDAAKRKVKSLTSELERTNRKLSQVTEEGKALKARTDEEDKIAESARGAFKDIMETASRVEDLGKRLETLERMRDARSSELAGTEYAERLDREISDVKKKAKGQAKETYASVERKLKMTKGMYDRQLEILRGAVDALAGTAYEDDIDAKIKRCEAAQKKHADAQKTKGAKEVYEAVMKRVKEQPTSYEENLAALKEAALKTEGTKYAGYLNKQVAAKERTLAVDIADAAYDDLRARIKKNREDYDGNITAAEAALAKAKDTKYEKKVQAILDDQKEDKLDHIGEEAYKTAVAKVKGSTDRDSNIAALEELKATAAGSGWEAKIDKLLAREQKYKDRGR